MRIVLGRIATHVPQASRHPEVNQQRTTRFEPDNQVLAATVERADTLPGQLGGDFERVVWTREPRVEDLDAFETAAYERWLEPAADGLDLGQLGHGARVVRPEGAAGC